MLKDWPSFDQLKEIAERSPEELEQFRLNEVNALIASAPEEMQQRLKGLQFQIDCKRRLHKTPLASCISISQMMQESVGRLNAVLNGNTIGLTPTEQDEDIESSVIPFPCEASR